MPKVLKGTINTSSAECKLCGKAVGTVENIWSRTPNKCVNCKNKEFKKKVMQGMF